jgi:demethylmenaquinone methyltransferase/2-methoxy-6-polyprenyl-1,4-benzoquinol methylase
MAMQSHKERNMAMFNSIAAHYDLLNHLLTAGIDRKWRHIAAASAASSMPHAALDAACGTADMSIAMAKQGIPQITGIDMSKEMINIGQRKINAAGLDNIIALHRGDAENMPFASETFDAATIAFGIRNYQDRHKGLTEAARVLRPHGRLVILEFSLPKNILIKWCYTLYFCVVLPLIGRVISRHKNAYHYLPQSVKALPSPRTLCKEIMAAGFHNVRATPLSLGIVHLYNAQKQ